MQVGPEKRPVRDQKKGPFAWQSVRQQSAIAPIEHEMLLTHSVSDNTALCSYLPAVREFVAWAEVHQPHLVTWGDLDLAITIYLTASCYMRSSPPSRVPCAKRACLLDAGAREELAAIVAGC